MDQTEMLFISATHPKEKLKSSSLTSISDPKGNTGRPKPMGKARRLALGGRGVMWEGLRWSERAQEP